MQCILGIAITTVCPIIFRAKKRINDLENMHRSFKDQHIVWSSSVKNFRGYVRVDSLAETLPITLSKSD